MRRQSTKIPDEDTGPNRDSQPIHSATCSRNGDFTDDVQVPAIRDRRIRPKPGILRLDISHRRCSSGDFVEARHPPFRLDKDTTSTSCISSPHQLSVTWATPPCEPVRSEKLQTLKCDRLTRNTPISESKHSIFPIVPERFGQTEQCSNTFPSKNLASSATAFHVLNTPNDSYNPNTEVCPVVEPSTTNYNDHTNINCTADNINANNHDENDDEEDYSLSVTAIMQRRASVRGYRGKRGSRGSRRASSPMDQALESAERRRSSVYTTSSEEGTNQESTQEQIFENIRLHKEVIQSVKLQPWAIRKKLKLVRQAKVYIARHEGALQERFAMSRSTRDLWVRFKILMAARWRHWKRETASLLQVLIPWELRIKEIESHFGSGVASFFTFLRWLMWVNMVMAIPLVVFVIGPEYFATRNDETDPRKRMSEQEYKVAGNLFTFWEFEGYIKYSPMFYGYYSNYSGASSLGYKLPLAYFLTALVVYIYSFVATLRKMAENSRNSKLSSKDDECTFSWKLFTGWDYMIGHAETAHNRIASFVVGFKEALLEEAEKKKDNNWRIILVRVVVNVVITFLLGASGYTVVALVNNADDLARKYDNWLSRNAVNVTMTLISFFLPMIFEALGLFENWHPRQQLRFQLARIMILNMLNLYSLMFSFIYKINSKEKPLQELKKINDTATAEMAQLATLFNSLTVATTTVLYDPSTISPSPLESGALVDELQLDLSESSSTIDGLLATTIASVAATTITSGIKCINMTMRCSPQKRVNTGSKIATTILMLSSLTSTPIIPTMSDINTATTYGTTDGTTKIGTTLQSFETTLPTTTTYLPTTSMPIVETTTYPVDLITSGTTTSTSIGNSISTKGKSTVTESTSSGTTELPTTSTTTIAPVNDSFFEYQDYFDGMSLQTNDAVDKVDVDSGLLLTRRARQLAATYSPVDNSLVTWQTTGSDEGEMDTTASSSTIPEPEKARDKLSPALEETNDRLLKMLAYFTTSTTTKEYDTTTLVPPIVSTLPTDETNNYYIDERDIVSTGAPFYLPNKDMLENGPFELCIVTVCPGLNSSEAFAGLTIPPPTGATDMINGSDVKVYVAPLTPLELYNRRLNEVRHKLSDVQKNLTTMCWETSLGQELSKVIVFDGIMSIAAPLCMDFLRGLFVRYMNPHWCWDMEKSFPQYGDFKIAENILTLINNQGQVWMGIFFSPGLVLINLVKLMTMMYFRSWIVLTCNVPHEVVFKASKSNNFYLSLLLTMLFLCVLPVGYAIVWLRPSWHCGPFSSYNRISEFITNTTRESLPQQLHEPLEYLTSSSTVIPLLLLLVLIIYYLVSLTGALREANQDLRTQLQKEREEERKKFFKAPEVKASEAGGGSITNRWRKVLEGSSPVTPTSQPPDFETDDYKNIARKELLSRIMQKALRKSSGTSDDDSVVHRDDDDTDNEHNDSLPHDEDQTKRPISRLQQIRRTRRPSIVDLVQITKAERSPTTEPTPKESRMSFRFKMGRGTKDLSANTSDRKPVASPSPPILPSDTASQVNNENDPETNSRIVNERRQSLLRHKNEEGLEKEVNISPIQPLGEPLETTAIASTIDTVAKNKFEVINEKKLPLKGTEESVEAVDVAPVAGIFNFKRLRSSKKNLTTTAGSNTQAKEPEVFKFDEKTVDKSQGKPSTISTGASDSSPSPSPTPTLLSSMQRQSNPDKFADYTRQGRKKIGNLLALVREAVNTKKPDEGESSTTPESDTPATPISPSMSTGSTGGKKNETMSSSPETSVVPVMTLFKRSSSKRDSPRRLHRQPTPTITISTTGSEECIPTISATIGAAHQTQSDPASTTVETAQESIPAKASNEIKIDIEDNESTPK